MSKTTILMKTESHKPSFLQSAWQKICEIVDPYHQKWLWWHGLSGRYDMVADIHFDLVIVVKDFRYGLIDKQGNVILRPLYEALDFLKEEALLEGTLPNKRTQLLDIKGKVLYEHPKEACFDHIDGHFLFLDELDTDDKKGKTGIVTSTGKLVIPPKFIRTMSDLPNGVINLRDEEQWYRFNLKTGDCTSDNHNYDQEWEEAFKRLSDSSPKRYDVMEHLMAVDSEEEWKKLQPSPKDIQEEEDNQNTFSIVFDIILVTAILIYYFIWKPHFS